MADMSHIKRREQDVAGNYRGEESTGPKRPDEEFVLLSKNNGMELGASLKTPTLVWFCETDILCHTSAYSDYIQHQINDKEERAFLENLVIYW
ncbi:hypothetical protein Cadr_000004950 [Camelus dromedarius]|uniref:Uncharacterized protein n=1 Tax=Camelus dromedarius TaxID=9838 RepID=A0A5N4ECU8_CAMDR|nr:hypothetical protein Cadr_000004950 [Camelus dromedarius]